MQLFALDDQGRVVQAAEAVKRQDYICLECKEPLHVRGGEIRQAHFYHVRPNQKCSLHQKSLKHLQVQWRLQRMIGEDCRLECPFPSIKRIADAVWISEKIIFEVQCSPITSSEVLQRNCDYASLGFRVVWLLHDSRYNQWRVSAAENALQRSPHYFTNIDRQGSGIIYDQYAYIHQGRRRETGPVLPVDLKTINFIPKQPQNLVFRKAKAPAIQSIVNRSMLTIWTCLRSLNPGALAKPESQILRLFGYNPEKREPCPRLLRDRLALWPLFFGGDLASQRCLEALQIEKKWDALLIKDRQGVWGRLIKKYLIKPYLSIFRYFLDSVD